VTPGREAGGKFSGTWLAFKHLHITLDFQGGRRPNDNIMSRGRKSTTFDIISRCIKSVWRPVFTQGGRAGLGSGLRAGTVIVLGAGAALIGGCSSANSVRERLQLETAEPAAFIGRATNTTGRITFAEACRRWAERDPETIRQVTQVLTGQKDVAEAKSWIWPRVDIEFRSTIAKDEHSDHYLDDETADLAFHYDLKKLLFFRDAKAYATAGSELSRQKGKLAVDAAIQRLGESVVEWNQLRQAVPLQNQRVAELQRLMEAVRLLDQLGTLPPGSFAEWKHREQVAVRERDEAVTRLENVRELLRTELELTGDVEPDFGNIDFLLNVPALPPAAAGDAAVQQWLPAVWQTHPSCRIAELELFQAELAVITARREWLPRLTGSLGLGKVDTWVGTNIVEASGSAEVSVTMPLFDAGTINRGISKAKLNREMARRNVRILAHSLARDVQSSLAALHTAQFAADHCRQESEDVRRLAEVAGQGAALGQGDPLLPFALRVYRVEAELEVLEANLKLSKAWLAYQLARGEEPVPGLSSGILNSLIHDLGDQ